MVEAYQPTLAAARARIAAVDPVAYARSRNAIGGAVSGLSPWITHGLVSLPEVLAGVLAGQPQTLPVQHKFVYELGWREYFRHVWQHRGSAILQSLHPGPLPDQAYGRRLPDDVRQACTGVPAIDQALRTLYTSGLLHNHARMWLASYLVHLRKLHWRSGADWLYGLLLDGDLASNHLSWQWVAGTASHKPYLFNADNVARHAPPAWHSAGNGIDASYDALEQIARSPGRTLPSPPAPPAHAGGLPAALPEPLRLAAPPASLGLTAPDPAVVAGRDVWLVHPWCLREPPADLPDNTLLLGICVADFHEAWPWSGQRWQFVGQRLAALCPTRWHADAATLGAALAAARTVHSVHDPHLAPWLPAWARCRPAPALFPTLATRCDSFSAWWRQATRGVHGAQELLGPGPGAVG